MLKFKNVLKNTANAETDKRTSISINFANGRETERSVISHLVSVNKR